MNHLKSTFILVAVLFLALTSCSKKADEPPLTSSIMQQGEWRVRHFSDNGVNETSNYIGYEFRFNSNKNVSAVKNGVTTNGTWNPGTNESDNKFILNFNSPALNELNQNWLFTMKSYSVVEMEHVSSSNGGTDILILEKL